MKRQIKCTEQTQQKYYTRIQGKRQSNINVTTEHDTVHITKQGKQNTAPNPVVNNVNIL